MAASTNPLRIILFGGPWCLSHQCFDRLRQEGHSLLLVAAPLTLRQRLGGLLGRRTSIERAANEAGAKVVRWGNPRRLQRRLTRFHPDLICVAAFPKRIPESLTEIPRLGAINVHPSLLPRHRGSNPIFWTYYHGDLEAGVTIHRVVKKLDAGSIVAQARVPLPRGYPREQLARDLIEAAGALLIEALGSVVAGAPEIDQDDQAATPAPRVDLARFRVPIEVWDVEQVWHFLAAYASSFRQPLIDNRGNHVPYTRVLGFDRRKSLMPGAVSSDARGWTLHCRGGTVRLEA